MMHWFTKIAPIRLKLFVAFGVMIAMMILMAALMFIERRPIALGSAACIVLASIVLGALFRKGIADPYVTTVVRMEALAAGDLASPIGFTEYRDCIGRISRGMVTFRDAAVEQKQHGEAQAIIVRILASHLASLAQGNLTSRIEDDFPAAYAELKTNFNEALASLRELIGSVSASAITIQSGSSEIANASEDLSRRTENNAAALQQTSSSLMQIDGRLKATAVAAAQTVARADQAIVTVGGGRAIAEEAVQAMGRVADSAKGIDSVIEGVDKIAFQTRVLAMNAAVEAGRAGDAGRGFAVVADLVSALAMRAEEEAKCARDQLTVTQADIVTAVEAVQKVDHALANISGDVDHVHQLLGNMAADNQAQSTAISQISVAIGTMDQSTQQNAAMVEETSAAARSLTNEVDALTEQAGQFQVGTPARPASREQAAREPASREPGRPMGYAPTRGRSSAAVATLVHTNDDWNDF